MKKINICIIIQIKLHFKLKWFHPWVSPSNIHKNILVHHKINKYNNQHQTTLMLRSLWVHTAWNTLFVSSGQRGHHRPAEVRQNQAGGSGGSLRLLGAHQTPAGPAERRPADPQQQQHWRRVREAHGRGERTHWRLSGGIRLTETWFYCWFWIHKSVSNLSTTRPAQNFRWRRF